MNASARRCRRCAGSAPTCASSVRTRAPTGAGRRCVAVRQTTTSPARRRGWRGCAPGTPASVPPVIDLRLVREDPDRVRASQRARGEDAALVDALLAADEQRRAVVTRADSLRAEQKALGREVAK